MSGLPDLERRRVATGKTLAHYQERSFDWRRQATCLHMFRFHGQAMGHHFPRIPPIRSELRALKELRARGHESVIDLVDTLLPRIAPAQMRLGDVAALPGDGSPFNALLINVAPRKFAGWHPDKFTMAIMDIELGAVTAAWRL